MTRLAQAAVLLAAIGAPAFGDEIDGVALLNKARAKILENTRRLPKYTCVQSVQRSRFEEPPAIHVKGCDAVESPGMATRMILFWADRLKLDVTVSAGQEIFSWVGARTFQSGDLEDIIGGGMTGTGDFGPFLMGVFLTNGTEYRYLGMRPEHGGTLAAYRYRVPVEVSHYQVKTGPKPDDEATMAYEGEFRIDPQTAELIRMTIEVPHPPAEAEICRVETDIEYGRTRIGGADLLLPQATVLKIWDVAAKRHENRIEYSACREFQAESVFRTDVETPAGASAAPAPPVEIPPGRPVRIALGSKIDSDTACAGDAVEGLLANDIRDRSGRVAAPAGSVVRGRIVRFERQYQPSHFFAVGLRFNSIEVNGREISLTLRAFNRSRKNQHLLGPVEKRRGVGMFMFRSDRLLLDRTFVSEWRTAAAGR